MNVARAVNVERPVTPRVPPTDMFVGLKLVAPRFVAKKLVEVPLVEVKFVANRLVEVALVVVALTPVKFCRVDDPVSSRLERVVRPPVAVRVPVKLAVDEIFCPFTRPEVRGPTDSEPN